MARLRPGAGLDRTALVASLTVAGVERARLGATQCHCPDLGVYVLIHVAQAAGEDLRAAVVRETRKNPGFLGGRWLDSVLENANRFEYYGGALSARA